MNYAEVKQHLDNSQPVMLLKSEGKETISAIIECSKNENELFCVVLNAYTIGRIIGIEEERQNNLKGAVPSFDSLDYAERQIISAYRAAELPARGYALGLLIDHPA